MISPLARLGVDASLARHVRGALSFYRSQLEQGGYPIPSGLDDLIEVTSVVVLSGGQLPPHVAELVDRDGCHVRHLLRISDAAALASVSVKTLRRRIADGELGEVRVTEEQFVDPVELSRWMSGRPAA